MLQQPKKGQAMKKGRYFPQGVNESPRRLFIGYQVQIGAREEGKARTKREVKSDVCPWASIVVDFEGGWMAFESRDDYFAWQNQR